MCTIFCQDGQVQHSLGAAVGGNQAHNVHHSESILGVVEVSAELTQNTVFCFCAKNMKISVCANTMANEKFPLHFPFWKNKTLPS